MYIYKKIYKMFLVALMLIIVGCTAQKSVIEASDLESTKTFIQNPVKVVDTATELSKYDWAKYSNYFLFALYLVLLATACIYFKQTGKRSTELETSLKTMSTRLSPVSKVLSYVAKLLGIIYCKKKK